MSMSLIGIALLQASLVVAAAPLLGGVMRRVRARLEGRTGAGIGQPWRDIRKQLAKERIISDHASWVFSAAPVVLVSTVALAAAIVPFLTTESALHDTSDLFAVVYLLLLGTVFLALAGLDPGTAFGGMGSSREMTIAALAEPAILLAIFALSVGTGSSNLSVIVETTLRQPETLGSPQAVLAFAALAIVTLAETGRLPVDNPNTHLELTMIHEAMTLEFAGPDLALVELAAQTRLVVFLGLLANLFLPWGIATTTAPADLLVAVAALAVKVTLLGVVIATFEVHVAKLRLFRVPELLAASFVLSFLAVTTSFFFA